MSNMQRIHPEQRVDIAMSDMDMAEQTGYGNGRLPGRKPAKRRTISGQAINGLQWPPISRVYRYADSFDYGLLAAGLLLALGQGLFSACSAVIFKQLTDALSAQQTDLDEHPLDVASAQFISFHDAALAAINTYVGCGIVVLVVAFVQSVCWRLACDRQIGTIRLLYFNAVLQQNSAWYDAYDKETMLDLISTGIDKIKEGMGDKIGVVIAYSVNFIASLIIAFCFSWKLTLITIGFAILLAGLLAISAQLTSSTTDMEAAQRNASNALLHEILSAIRIVVAYNGQERETRRYAAKLEKATGFGIRRSFMFAVGTAFIYLLVFIAMAVFFWVGALVKTRNQITVGAVFGTFWALMNATLAIGKVIKQVPAICDVRLAAMNIFNTIDMATARESSKERGAQLDSVEGELEFRHIIDLYPVGKKLQQLEVNFKVPARSSIAIVGPPESGVRSLAALILRFREPESGEILLDNFPIRRLDTAWLRRTIGLVSNESTIFDGTVLENIRLGRGDLTENDMKILCGLANAHNFIHELPQGYMTVLGAGGYQLPAHQSIRIALARTISNDPRVLVIDQTKPMKYDEHNENLVREAIEKARHDRTSITFSQRIGPIRCSDYIMVMNNGRIVEAGTDRELVGLDGFYAAMLRAELENDSTGTDTGDDDEGFVVDAAGQAQTASGQPATSSQLLLPMVPDDSRKYNLRLAWSLIDLSTQEKAVEELKDEAVQQGYQPASLGDIISFAYSRLLLCAVLATTLKGLMFPIFSIIYASVFWSLSLATPSAVLSGVSMDALYFFLLGFFVAWLALAESFLFGWVGEMVSAKLRYQLLLQILRQDGAGLEMTERAPNRLMNNILRDMPGIRFGIDKELASVTQNVCMILVGFIIALSYGPLLAVLGIFLCAVFTGAQLGISFVNKKKFGSDIGGAFKPARLVIQAIQHHEAVKSCNQEPYFLANFQKFVDALGRVRTRRMLLDSLSSALQVCFAFINFACLYGLGVHLIEASNYEPFNVFQVVEALNCAAVSLFAFNVFVPEYVHTRYNAGRILKMLQLKPSIDCYSEGGKRLDIFGDIQLNRLSLSNPSNPTNLCLRSVDMHIPQARTVVLTGPKGYGGSAVIELLERLYDPTEGTLNVDCVDVREMNIRHLRSQLAVVTAEPLLFNSLTIRDNIAYGIEGATQEQIEEAALRAQVHDLIKSLPRGYDTKLIREHNVLTMAQRQKICIARAIIRDPRVLLMADVTSNLEVEEREDVLRAINGVRRGRTCLIATERIEESDIADLIVVMLNGRVLEVGVQKDLLERNGVYGRLCREQQRSGNRAVPPRYSQGNFGGSGGSSSGAAAQFSKQQQQEEEDYAEILEPSHDPPMNQAQALYDQPYSDGRQQQQQEEYSEILEPSSELPMNQAQVLYDQPYSDGRQQQQQQHEQGPDLPMSQTDTLYDQPYSDNNKQQQQPQENLQYNEQVPHLPMNQAQALYDQPYSDNRQQQQQGLDLSLNQTETLYDQPHSDRQQQQQQHLQYNEESLDLPLNQTQTLYDQPHSDRQQQQEEYLKYNEPGPNLPLSQTQTLYDQPHSDRQQQEEEYLKYNEPGPNLPLNQTQTLYDQPHSDNRQQQQHQQEDEYSEIIKQSPNLSSNKMKTLYYQSPGSDAEDDVDEEI